MSTRPSNSLSCCETEYSGNHAVIGDTASAIFHVFKLLRAGVSMNNIYLYTLGNDSTNANLVTSTRFIPCNVKTIISHLIHDKIHYTRGAGRSLDCTTDTAYIEGLSPALRSIVERFINKKTVSYFSGSGPVGNIIAAYHIPHFGPWFPDGVGNSSAIRTFIDRYSTMFDNNPTEATIADRLSEMWSVPLTADPVVPGPAVMCKHRVLKRRGCAGMEREIFKRVYDYIISKSNVSLRDNSDTIFFDKNCEDGTYDITNKNQTIPNLHVTLKTNPVTTARIASRGGLRLCNLKLPTFYRAVIPITSTGQRIIGTVQTDGTLPVASYGPVVFPAPINNPCAPTTSCGPNYLNDDYILTHNTFSLYDVNANVPSQSSNLDHMVWTGSTYVTTEDFADVSQSGWFASPGTLLLIVECICFKNIRPLSYNYQEDHAVVHYNSVAKELYWLRQFARIVSDIHMAITGVRVIPDSILNIDTFTLPTGQSMEANLIKNYSQRDSPMTSTLELIAGNYGKNYYPVE